MKFFIDALISCGTFMGRETQRGIHSAFKFFPGIKINHEQELCFQSLVIKRKKMFSEYGKASYTSFCVNYVRVLVSQDRNKGHDIRASDSLSSDLQHPAVKRVLLL